MLLIVFLGHAFQLVVNLQILRRPHKPGAVWMEVISQGDYKSSPFRLGLESLTALEYMVSLNVWATGKIAMVHIICENAPQFLRHISTCTPYADTFFLCNNYTHMTVENRLFSHH